MSLWWIAGLWAQGRYGIPILRYTETYETVAKVSNAPELLRGLGYWFFYGDDKLGPWIEPSVAYTQHLWLIGAGYLLGIGALLAAGAVRWQERGYFVAMLAIGTLIAVGSHPYDDPSPYGSLFARFTRLDLGLALRSTPRAVPLIILALAVMLGAGVRALARWRPQVGLVAATAAVAVAVINLPPLFTGQMVANNLQRPEELPDYWGEDAAHLDAQGNDTRVLELAGADFASYRWGNTVDPVLPGLMDRPYVARELIPYGSAPSADLLNAVDRRMQEGWFEPSSLATVAALDGRGRDQPPLRPAVRALPHASAAQHVATAARDARSGRTGDLRRPGPQPRDPRAPTHRRGGAGHSSGGRGPAAGGRVPRRAAPPDRARRKPPAA